MKKCLVCNKRKAINHPTYGYLPCKRCQDQNKPRQVEYELTTEEIKDARKIYADDILQPYRDGQLSGEYVKKYPDRIKHMLKEGHISQQDVNNAKPVWNIGYYKED